MTLSKKVSLTPCESGTKTDRISDLPDVIIDQILSYLPIKDRAKTSILSTNWRYNWASNPILVFDNESLPVLKDDYGNAMINKLVSDIDSVLLLNFGPVSKFELSYEHDFPLRDVHRWIIHISRQFLTELVVKLNDFRIYRLPSCVFSLISLTCLDLMNCVLKPPSTFMGFKNLKSFSLNTVTVHQNVFEKFVSSCPLLEKLNLVDICVVGIDLLIIRAPNLQHFGYKGRFRTISLQNTNCIVEFIISVSFKQSEHLKNSFNLVKLLAAMPLIEKLAIESVSILYFADGIVVPRSLPFSCANLRYLSVCVDLTVVKETSVLHSLLRSAPNLQELYIELTLVNKREIKGNDWQVDQLNHPFTYLRYIKINFFSGQQCEIDFINFMLLTSPALVKMVISVSEFKECVWGCNGDKTKLDFTKELLCLKRASAQAQIIYEDS